jgi:hypothetical protein
MVLPKLLGPYSIHQCSKNSSNFHRLTEIAYNKAKNHGTLILYLYLNYTIQFVFIIICLL